MPGSSYLKTTFLSGVLGVFVLCSLGFGVYHPYQVAQQEEWPERYSASFGFDLMIDHNSMIIISSIDSTSQAYKLGIRPGMEILGWNKLPIRKKLESMKVNRYRKQYPLLKDLDIRLMLITRGRPGETAEIFFMTETGNNRGLRLTAQPSS
jgi:predicted metalloprotease with PDZ domain